MKFLRFTLFLCVLTLSWQASYAQMPKKVYQLSGLIISTGGQNPVPFARIAIKDSRRGGFANLEGFYSIPVFATDTVYFSSIGFKPTIFVIGDYLEDYEGNPESNFIYAINYLVEDSITLPMVQIFPYNTTMELKTAILETDLPEAIENINARNNLDPGVMDFLIDNLTVDEGERVMVARQMYYNQQLTKNVAPTMALFDPIAIYQLLKYIQTKTKDKRTKDLDYWNN